MKELTVDGKVYVLKTEHEKLLKKADKTDYPKLNLTEFHVDKSLCLGIGSAKLSGDWVKSRFTIDLIKKAMKVLEALGEDTVDIVFTKDHPVIFGTIKEGRKTVAGVIVAPRVGED